MGKLEEIPNFLRLSENLLTGGQPSRPQLAAAAAAGVKVVVNLAIPTGPKALPGEEQAVRELGMEYVGVPVIWEKPGLAELDQFMDVMDRLGERVTLVHCAANMRVSAFMALYRILRLGWSREKAFQDLHRIWNPDDIKTWQAFIASALARPQAP